MSGRSGFAKSDHPLLGRERKTRTVTPPEQMPDMRLTFPVPGVAQLRVKPGPYHDSRLDMPMMGVSIEDTLFGLKVVVVGKDRGWVQTQAGIVLGCLADGQVLSVRATIQRPSVFDEAGRAHAAFKTEQEIIYVPRACVVCPHPHGQPQVIAVRRR